jgi:pyroglutamyl-peptidase
MRTILLTGFEPFGGDSGNPSGDAVRDVAVRWDGDGELVSAVLPVEFDAADREVRGLIRELRPDVVIATGLAGGRTVITPERVAINLRDARIPDNSGAQPIDEPTLPGGPAAYFATLPVKRIARAVGGSVSHSAGTFVCNDVMYAVLDETRGSATAAGFIHVPWSDELAPEGQPPARSPTRL